MVLIIAPPGRRRDSLRVLLRANGRLSLVEPADDARSGQQSIAARPPGLVLLDADLGDGDAQGALRQIKTQWPQLPCLVLVHNHDQEQMAWAAGADAVLQAGFSTETFFSTIKHLLADRAL
jgi:DNA-binding NarL/FixJ family response regulator